MALGVIIVLLIGLWLWVYLHTTEGARFGCMPNELPKWVPQVIRDWLDLYCGS